MTIHSSHEIGELLSALGILRHPNLLDNTVIRLPDGDEYLLTTSVARQLIGQKHIELYRLSDSRQKKWSPKEIRSAIKYGRLFDQL